MGPLGWIGLTALGAALLWVLNLTFTNTSTLSVRQDQRRQSKTIYALYAFSWLLVVVGIVWPATALSYGPGLVSLVLLGLIAHASRQRETESLLWLLGLAMQKEIPVHRMARAFANERCDESGARARRLAVRIEQGMSLARAMAAMRYRLPAHADLAVNMDAPARETGQMLLEAVRQRRKDGDNSTAILYQLFYYVCLLWIVQFVVSFSVIRVMPAIEMVATDMGVPMTRSMELITRGSGPFAAHSRTAVRVLGLANLGLFVFLLQCLGWIRYEPFFVRRLTRRYHASILLKALAIQVKAEVPAHTALEKIGNHYPRQRIRKRLASALVRVNRGEAWQTALQIEKLIKQGDANVLAAAERAGNLPWALDATADGILRRLKYRLTLWARVAGPMIIVLLAIVVGVFSVAVFSILSELILKGSTPWR